MTAGSHPGLSVHDLLVRAAAPAPAEAAVRVVIGLVVEGFARAAQGASEAVGAVPASSPYRTRLWSRGLGWTRTGDEGRRDGRGRVRRLGGAAGRGGPAGVLKGWGCNGVDAVLVTMKAVGCGLAEARAMFFAAPCRAAEHDFHNAAGRSAAGPGRRLTTPRAGVRA